MTQDLKTIQIQELQVLHKEKFYKIEDFNIMKGEISLRELTPQTPLQELTPEIPLQELTPQENKNEKLVFLFKNLKIAREMKEKSQTEISEPLKVSFQQYQKYESNLNSIPIHRAVQVAEYLGYKEDDLFSFFFEDFVEKAKYGYKSKFSKEQKDFFMEAINCFKDKGYLGLAGFFDNLRRSGGKLTYKKIEKEYTGKTLQQIGKYFTGHTKLPIDEFVNLLNYFYAKKYLDN